MTNINGVLGSSTAELLKQNAKATKPGGAAFAEHLKGALEEVNRLQVNKEKAVAEIATGEVKDLHQAALSIGKAETNMKLMLEIRNKALSAYKELGRTQL
ncbi:MAG: flagellar hook-basal body complex protein FliE [Sulfurimonas sp.]|nr:flagellar hook-basal body complex protein FliE [Sulfurimonas sp.]